MSALIRYETARTALAEAHRVDEVKDIRDKAEAMAAYARQAKDQQLILWATEIKIRAEQKTGELLAQVDRSDGGRPAENSSKAETSYQRVLRENDIPRATAHRYEQLAAMPPEHFETAIATAKATAGEVTTAFMLREAKAAKPQPKPIKTKKAEAQREELRQAQERGVSLFCTYARLTIGALNALDELTDEERQVFEDLRTAVARMATNCT